MNHAGKEESFEHEALRLAEKIASKKAKKKSLASRVRGLFRTK